MKSSSSASAARLAVARDECCLAIDHLRAAVEKLDHGSLLRRQLQAALTLAVSALDNMPRPRQPMPDTER